MREICSNYPVINQLIDKAGSHLHGDTFCHIEKKLYQFSTQPKTGTNQYPPGRRRSTSSFSWTEWLLGVESFAARLISYTPLLAAWR